MNRTGYGPDGHFGGCGDALGFGSTHARTRMSSPPIAVAGCIHDTNPMMATCTTIQTRQSDPAVNALARAMRERTKTAPAANQE